MKLSDLADLSAIVQTVFLLISIVFVWYELHKSNKLTRAQNVHSLVELSSPFNLQLIHREMATLWVRGRLDYPQMDEVDQYRYESLLLWWLILHENIFYQWRGKLLDDDVYFSWERDLRDFIKHRLDRSVWNGIKTNYQIEFAQQIDHFIAKYGSG